MKYIKLDDSQDFWLLQDNGKRLKMQDMADVYAHGLFEVETVSAEVLESYPIEKPLKTKEVTNA